MVRYDECHKGLQEVNKPKLSPEKTRVYLRLVFIKMNTSLSIFEDYIFISITYKLSVIIY